MSDEQALPELDEREIRFAELYLQGQSASDAYREAFGVHHWKPQSVWVKASELSRDDRVKVWIESTRKLRLVQSGCTFEGHLSELVRLREIALEKDNIGAAVQAEKIRGEVAGHKTERVEVRQAAPEQTLEQIARYSPELARELARQEGVDWRPDVTAGKETVH